MALRRIALETYSIFILTAQSIAAQVAVRGLVTDQETGSPLGGARVTALISRQTTVTNRFGRFEIWIKEFPDTLLIAYIGHQPATLALAQLSDTLARVSVLRSAAVLSDVIVKVPPQTVDRSLTSLGRWQLSLGTMRNVPPAVETDVYRSLLLVPAVSFSSLLSARPLVRGYGAEESSFRIDGFEVISPYHIGRIFSAFPAEAADQVSVITAPQSAETGGLLTGVIDVSGRTGPQSGTDGGANLSLASATAWAGGQGGPRWFVGARAVHISAIDAVTDKIVPYDFQDIYSSGLVMRNGQPVGRLTLFASRDDLFDSDLGSGMDWKNLLLGSRWQLLRRSATSLEVSTAGTAFSEDVVDLPARHSRIDVRNRFARITGAMDLGINGVQSQLRAGTSIGVRSISNRVTARAGYEFPESDVKLARFELGIYSELTHQIGSASIQVGARLDGAGEKVAFQPRGRLTQTISDLVSVGIAAGRASRLYHLVSDPASEPDFAFYDFWLNAGENGVPVPVVDHAAVDLNIVRHDLTARGSVFTSRARGLAELRPATEVQSPTESAFRYGRGEAHGLELQVALSDRSATSKSLTTTYVLSWSKREWGGGWIPWTLERRHQFRVVGQLGIRDRWSFVGAFEAASGVPMTPVDAIAIIGTPDPREGGVVRDAQGGRPAYVYGPENSGRSGGTARLDIAAGYSFRGLWSSRMSAGISITNVGFGNVAPLRPAEPITSDRVIYERRFEVPAVPTLTLRVEF